MKDDLSARLILPPDGARILCAVSGGADSMCMLTLLRERGSHPIAVAHFEHGIRGEESLRDCAFVEEYCRERGIACFIGHADVPAYAREKGLGIEEAARELRYDFLEKTAEAEGYDWIATAHNADDNAETVLFNLARGTGLNGLCGIPPRRGKIIRPLLRLTRTEIEEILAARGTAYVEDSTNENDLYSRNRIRHTVIPELRRINPAFSEAVARTGVLLRRDGEYLEKLADDFVEHYFDGSGLPARELLKLHEAVSTRVLRKILKQEVSSGHVEAVLELCRSTECGFLDLPGTRVRCERGRLCFRAEEAAPFPETEIPVGGCVFLEEAGITIRTQIAAPGEEIHSPFKTYRLKYESINGTLNVAPPRPGERYRPAGRGCTKTLKSLFSEAQSTQSDKLRTPVIRDGTGIVLVPPFGEAERCMCGPQDTAVAVTIERK